MVATNAGGDNLPHNRTLTQKVALQKNIYVSNLISRMGKLERLSVNLANTPSYVRISTIKMVCKLL